MKIRLVHVFDLPVADAIYHQKCNVYFRTEKCVPKAYQSERCVTPTLSSCRPDNVEQREAFKKNMSFLEGAVNETLTVSDLVTQMTNAWGDKAYSTKHMKKKIIEHFGNNVVISSVYKWLLYSVAFSEKKSHMPCLHFGLIFSAFATAKVQDFFWVNLHTY